MSVPRHEDILKTIQSNPSRFGVTTGIDLDLGVSKLKPSGLPSNEAIFNTINANPSKYGITGKVTLPSIARSPALEVETPKEKLGFFGSLKNIVSDIFTGFKKLAPRATVTASNLITSTVDFAADILAYRIEQDIRDPLIMRAGKNQPQAIRDLYTPEKNKEIGDKWANFYETTVGKTTEGMKRFAQSLWEREDVRPSDEWVSSSTIEKYTKPTLLFETIFYAGPGVIASMGAFALNPALGYAVSAGSTADSISTAAQEAGVPKGKAMNLGLGTGLLVGLVDKWVPDELFGPQQKGKFVSGFTKRVVVKTALKEFGTEIVQEDIEIAVESTFREDLGMDEIAARNAMAGLGGLLGGAGGQITVNFANQIKQGNIGNITSADIKAVETKAKMEVGEEVVGEAKILEPAVVEIPERLKEIAREKDAHKLVSAEDFAVFRFGTDPDSQIGIIDADRIVPRDPVDVESEAFVNLEADIKAVGIKEPVVVNVLEDKTIETTDGSNRVVIAQRNNLEVPVLVTKGNIEGLKTVGDLYESVRVEEEVPTKKLVVEEKEIRRAKELVKVTEEQTKNVKNIRDVKTTLKNTRLQLQENVVQAEALAVIAREQRAGINTTDVGTLKRVYARSKKFQAGDIETIRAHSLKSKNLVNRVVENVREAYPNLSEQEAFDFALGLPTKGDEVPRNATISQLEGEEKKLSKYLDQLRKNQERLKIAEDDALTREWTRALIVQEKLHAILRVPSTQLPVGEGIEKVSRLQARVTGHLDALKISDVRRLKEGLGLTTYNQMIKVEQIAKASEYVANNPEDALLVLKGKIEPPQGLLVNSIYVALKELGSSDTELATKLATLSATRMGQEISILSEIDVSNPVTIMEEVVNTRIEAFEKKTKRKVSEKVKQEVEKITKEQKAPSIRQWDSFLESIRC